MSVAEALGRDHFFDSQANQKDKYFSGLYIHERHSTDSYDGETEGPPLDPRHAKPRIDEGHRGMLYGERDYDRGHPHPRPMQDPFRDRTNENADRVQRERADMEFDIQQLKDRQMREKAEREEEKKRNYEILTNQFPWDQNSKGHGAPRKRDTDLFLNTLGGPGGTVMRQDDGYPGLQDPRYQQQQENFRANQGESRLTPKEYKDYSRILDEADQRKKMQQQENKMNELRSQIEMMKGGDMDGRRSSPFKPDFSPRKEPQRSLDLENTRGGAGAPFLDDRGKAMTRRPITLARNDFGESRIREEMPGASPLDFMQEDTRPYYPWGKEGGGAPIRDREGNVVTQIYGKLGGRGTNGSGEARRARRRQEVLYNELKQGEQEHKQSKEELERFLRAPQADTSDLLLAGRVGRPKRDAITGEIGQQHLPNSDVSRLKMNYQEKPISEKKQLHDELSRAAEERRAMRELEKRKEMQESNAHFRNMDSTWGAFGGGAPKHNVIRKKANLTNSLFYPDASPPVSQFDNPNPRTGLGSFESPIASYQRLQVGGEGDLSNRYPSPDGSPRYAKTTIPSSHKNNFEGTTDRGFIRGRNVAAPYATGAGVY